MKILLIGAGRTGRAIAENLLEIKDINNLFLYSRTPKSSKSLASDLDSKKVRVINEIKSLSDIDYIIITLSGMSDSSRDESIERRKTTYQVRQDELKYNLGAIIHLVEDLKALPNKTSIIVVTNPVDEITNYLRIMLKKPNIFGFGMELDVKRYEKALGKKVLCIGTHGKAIPLINSKKGKEYDLLLKKTDRELLKYIREHGIPHKMAGVVFKEFFDKLISNKENIIHVSYYLKNDFSGIKDVSISLPWKVKKRKILGLSKMKLNGIEKQRFVNSVKELKNSVNHILETHKKLMGYK